MEITEILIHLPLTRVDKTWVNILVQGKTVFETWFEKEDYGRRFTRGYIRRNKGNYRVVEHRGIRSDGFWGNEYLVQ